LGEGKPNNMKQNPWNDIDLIKDHIHQTILDNAPLGIWLLGLDGRLRFVNKTFCEAVGISEHDFLSVPHYAELYPKEMAANCMRTDKECLQQEQPHISVEYVPFMDGQIHVLEITKVKLRDSNGSVQGIIGLAMDVTEKHHALNQLKLTRQRFEQLAGSVHEVFWLASSDWRTLFYVSPSYERIWGKSCESLYDSVTSWMDRVHKDDLPGLRRHLSRYIDQIGRDDIHFLPEFRVITEEGNVRWIRARVYPVVGDSGQQSSIAGVAEDITERKQTQLELKRREVRDRLLLESMDEGIIGFSAAGQCNFSNAAAQEMLGFSEQEIGRSNIAELITHLDSSGKVIEYERTSIYRALNYGQRARVSDEMFVGKSGPAIAVDYSVSPVVDEQGVNGAVIVFRNVTEARAMAKKMDYLATHDALTGLVNRREFERVLGLALASARQSNLTHVLCYLDLDQFKVVNDTCGHVAGDELLRQLGDVMHASSRSGDTVSRLGGDEFGVLFLNCTGKQAQQVLDRLLHNIQVFRFIWGDKTFSVGISAGLVEVNAETESLTTALSSADAACYVAKETGRNRVHTYQPDDQELLRRRSEMQWVNRIQQALENDSFRLRFQPIISLGEDGVQRHCYELLLDMIDASGGVIPPGAFLPAAERYNLMLHIDRWVVSNGLAWAEDRFRAGDEFEFCTINISGDNLGSPGFLEFVIDQLKRYPIPNQRVCFEITETAAISNINHARRFMRELKLLGCQFALDDFGSGMSSFAYLKNLPVDLLKIDGNFIRGIAVDEVDRVMVESINQVGHAMKLKTIAEFVEDQPTMDILLEIGVDYVQGNFVYEPLAISELGRGMRDFRSITQESVEP